jgi:rhodanese-related sulfurtransferase
MPSPNEITCAQLARLIGTPDAPVLVDLRDHENWLRDPRLLPGSLQRTPDAAIVWGAALKGRKTVTIGERADAHGIAAWLRANGTPAEVLEGGFDAWRDAGGLLVNAAKIPRRDLENRSVWVTRLRPKIDRIACPWLIRRFIDPDAIFLFVPQVDVGAVAERTGGAPFDIDGVFWSHRGDRCTFDTMIQEFGLESPALDRLATIIRGADTARLDLAPQSAGLLAASLGLSRMYRDDLEQLDATMPLYDAFYRWCRDAVDEPHTWPARP